MKQFSTLVLSACLLMTLSQLVFGQGKPVSTRASVTPEVSHREQDGLNGPVRRVRVETAKVNVQDGKFVEGSRVLREVTTYDQNGKKLDSVAYPVEGSTLPGKEEYTYDESGNIAEMILRGDDGTILSRETYKYELDEMKNWNKMTSSVAIYENGKVNFEPIEVTYRTIAYFYRQGIEKVASASGNRPNASLNSKSSSTLKVESESKPASSTTERYTNAVNVKPPPTANVGSGSSTVLPAAPSSDSKNETAPLVKADNKIVNTPPEKVSVRRVTEKDLRVAAIDLPLADYSSVAVGIAPSGSKVEVHVVIGDNGEVVNARATSGHRLLVDAAEVAARKARFSREKLSPEPGQVYGILTYEYKSPAPQPALVTSVSNISSPEASKNNPVEANAAAGLSKDKPTAGVNSVNESAASLYEKGMTHLVAGKYDEAVKALEQSVKLSPNDARTYLKLGLAYSAYDQYKEAVAAFQMAIHIKPDAMDAQGYYHLGYAYSELGKHKKALEAFQQVLYITRAESVEQLRQTNLVPIDQVHLRIGVVYHNLGRHQDAIKALKQALDMNPKLAHGYYVLSLSYFALGNRIWAENQRGPLRTLDPALEEKLAVTLSGGALKRPCRSVGGSSGCR